MNKNLIDSIKKGPNYFKKWRSENPKQKLDFSNANLSGLNLYDLDSRDDSQYYILDLSNSIFTNSNLEGAQLELIDLNNSDFSNANLKHCSFRKSNCSDCNFKGSILTNSSFHRSDISNSNFENSNLDNSDLTASSMDNINLKNVSLLDSDLPEFDSIDLEFGMDPFSILTSQNILTIQKNSLQYLKPKFAEILDILSTGYVIETWEFKDPQDKIIRKGKQKIDFRTELIKRGEYENYLNKINFLVNYFSQSIITEVVDLSSHINKELMNFLKNNPKEIHNIHWREFEVIIAELLSFFGWTVELTTPSKDGGYDIFGIYTDKSGINHHWIVECKKWSSENMVGVDVVRSLYGVKSDLKIGNALLATTSNFTQGAKDFKLSRYDLELKDYNNIIEWINHYK